jgi:hypothetical protein
MNVLINFIKAFKDKLKKISNSIQPPWKLPKGSCARPPHSWTPEDVSITVETPKRE